MARVQVSVTVDGKNVATLAPEAKTFKSGKTGFWGQNRIDVGGDRYMAQVQLVKIAPKT